VAAVTEPTRADLTTNEPRKPALLPYSRIVGQDVLRWVLEVAYVMGSQVGGVLVSGERGTAKSTIVRAFAIMMYGQLPATLPINATDDRVMGGWDINQLVNRSLIWKNGLVMEADRRMLYIDEVNLLDDHIVNLILDVVSTGVLVVEREGMDRSREDVSFMLVGTMNPEEGELRPQLLDRFGLFAEVKPDWDENTRRKILTTVLRFDTERAKERRGERSDWLDAGRARDVERKESINAAQAAVPDVELTAEAVALCVRVATKFEVVGHRADIVIAEGARAAAALAGRRATTPADVRAIAPHAVMHRRRELSNGDGFHWSQKDDELLDQIVPRK
jgi:magnesium chelatase subunit I